MVADIYCEWRYGKRLAIHGFKKTLSYQVVIVYVEVQLKSVLIVGNASLCSKEERTEFTFNGQIRHKITNDYGGTKTWRTGKSLTDHCSKAGHRSCDPPPPTMGWGKGEDAVSQPCRDNTIFASRWQNLHARTKTCWLYPS